MSSPSSLRVVFGTSTPVTSCSRFNGDTDGEVGVPTATRPCRITSVRWVSRATANGLLE